MSTPCHALVFRDVREHVSLTEAVDATLEDLDNYRSSLDEDHLYSALLRAGEIECAMADRCDQDMPGNTYLLARAITDFQCRKNSIAVVRIFLSRLSHHKDLITVSRPEGFAFYGIHPLDYLDALSEIPVENSSLVIIGIRSIGLTLGTLLYAALRPKMGNDVEFFTLRPSGHPYDRRCEFKGWHARVVERHSKKSKFIIVDEGPGLSGSSFLSVAEELVAHGVDPKQIVFLCSRKPDPSRMVAPNGAQRWSRFKTQVASRNHCFPEADAQPRISGDWRNSTMLRETQWPGLWTSMLPAKFRSADGERTFEYHGLGRYGRDVRQRIDALAWAGFTVPALRAANGFSRTNLHLAGCRLSKCDLGETVINRMAEYVAVRAKVCAVSQDAVHIHELESMAQFNFQQSTGRELPTDFSLSVRRPVIADAQMMPHTWLKTFKRGSLLKLDCGTHGDNHFFPGPVDIAWDIAGAIVEWEMSDGHRRLFLARYNDLSKEDVSQRLDPYITAYAAFRNGYCRMAASAMAHDPAEQARLLRDAERYRCALMEQASRPIAAAAAYR